MIDFDDVTFSHADDRARAASPVLRGVDLHIQEGDLLSFRLDGQGRVIMEKVDLPDAEDLAALEATLTEWSSPEDERAWAHL